MRRWQVCAGLLLLLSGSAAVAAEPRGYVGGSVGQSELKARYTADGLEASIDQKESAYKIFAGARLGLLGLEGGYVDFGRPRATVNGSAVDVHTSGFDAFATLNFDVGPATVFAKGGALNWKADATVGGLSADRSGTTGAWGAGADFKLTDHLSARGEYEKFESSTFSDLHIWSVGLELTF